MQVKRESTWQHPLLPYYRGAVYMALGGKAAVAKAEATKPCTDAEVRDMAEYLGIDMDTESDLLDIARMAVAVPTPPGWQQLDNSDGFAVFRNLETGQEQEAHPLDEYFAELIRARLVSPKQSGPFVELFESCTALVSCPWRRRLAHKPEGAASTSAVDSKQASRAASTMKVDSKQAGRAAVQVGAAERQQSAKPKGNSKPRPVENSESEPSSNSTDVDEDDNSAKDASSGEEEEGKKEEEEDSSQDSSAEESRRQKQESPAWQTRSSSQQEDDDSKDEDESAVVSRPSQLQQQLPRPSMTAFAAVATAGDDSVLAMQQMSQQHTEHMHVAVRARPVPSGSSSSCWIVDPSTAIVTLNARQTTAKRKQAQHYQGVSRSSNSNGSYLDGGLSRRLLSSAPSTPNVWDPSGTSGTSMGYKFDQVLNEDAETAAVYARCIQNLVQSALEGINGTVLAYGQTGSGKTHTIMGERHEAGAIALAIDDIFATTAAAPADQFAFRVDMVEIYNEELRDLLAPINAKQKKQQSLQIKEDPTLGVRVSGAYEELVSEPARMKQLFQRGNSRRQTSSHRMNAVSSRSHAIFQIMIERRRSTSSSVHVSTLNFVDLAGSERIEKSGNDFEALRIKEATNINVSLLMLGNVISKLAERSVHSMASSTRAGSPARAAQSSPDHIPFRNSKLTRLLQPSLGGNARTAVIATINPSADQMEETSHTLRLASRAMAVTNRVSANEVMSDGDMAKQYQSELNQLRHHLSRRESGEEQSVAVVSLKQQVKRLEDQNLALALQLEIETGRPASDWASIPATPSGLSLPNQFAKASRSPTSAEQALKLIARTTALNRPTLPSVHPSSPSGASSSSPLGPPHSFSERLYGRASSDDVVQSVRRLRAERDQLRLRDRDHARSMHQVEGQLFELEQLQQQLPLLQQATVTLEDLLGSTPLPDFHPANSDQAQLVSESLPARLEAAAETASLVVAELQSIHRQHVTTGLLLQQEEARSKQLEADLVHAKASVSDRTHLAEQLAQAQLSQSTASGLNPTSSTGTTPGGSAAAPPGGVALQLVKVLQQQVENLEGRLAAGEKQRKALKKELAQWSSLEPVAGERLPFPVGSVAVRQARHATLRAHQAEQQLAAAVAERNSLACQVEELKPPEMRATESPSDAEAAASPEAALQRVKKRVYALSSEVAHLTRERDMLRIQFGQQPGPTLPAGSVRFHTPGHVYPGPPSSSPGQPLQMPLVQSTSEILLPTLSGRLQNADRSPGALSSFSSRDGMLSLPTMLGLQGSPSRQPTASIRSSGSKKKSKRGKASSKGVRAGKGPKRGLAAADSALLSGSRLAAEGSGPRADWVDPTRSEDVPVQEVGTLKKRLVASERERKQALADAAAENRVLQLQLQALSKAAQQAGQLDQQVTSLQAQQMQTLQFNEALQAQRVQDAAQLKALLAENEHLRIHK
ncbi:hypothetical protein WJX77_004210 [Trebouxia sp. C0004]